MSEKKTEKKPGVVVTPYKPTNAGRVLLPRVEVFDFGYKEHRDKYAWAHANPSIEVGTETGTFDKVGIYHLVSFMAIEESVYAEVCQRLDGSEFDPGEFTKKKKPTAAKESTKENIDKQEDEDSVDQPISEDDIVDDE